MSRETMTELAYAVIPNPERPHENKSLSELAREIATKAQCLEARVEWLENEVRRDLPATHARYLRMSSLLTA